MGAESERASERRARWTLALLTLVYALNFVDRQILAILNEPIQRELGASDAQMGLLTGTAFTLAYTFAGVAVARWADRGPRTTILALGLSLWSAATAAGGFARTYAQLALARIGVGLGEAACTPTAHSLLSDLFAPARRATAIAVYSSGIYFGYFIAYDLGGWLSERYGWRATLAAVGLPGLILALVVQLALHEPDRRTIAAPSASSAFSAVQAFFADRALFHVSLGAGIKSIAGYGLAYWVPTFLGRVHGMGAAEAGAWLGPIFGLGGALGTFGGGWLADRLGARDPRWRMRTAAIATLTALPFLYAFLFAGDAMTALLAYIPASVLGAAYLGPVFALAQDRARPDQRATASAVLLFVINLIGLGLGPWLVGWLNDALASELGPSAIRWSLALVSLTYAWGALHLLAAGRRVSIRR